MKKSNFITFLSQQQFGARAGALGLATFLWMFVVSNNDYVTIAYLETDDTVAELGAPEEIWIDNLEKSLDYFEEIEDYTKCQEVVQLLEKLRK